MSRQSIPESFLCVAWSRRLYRSEGLATADGRAVEVLEPGRRNTDSGPDFRGARVCIGGVAYTGDVEVHLDERGWEAHDHDDDPAYNSVILHVVLWAAGECPRARTAARRVIPLVVLRPFLDPMLEAQASQLIAEEDRRPAVSLACAGRTARIDPAFLEEVLERQGIERFELKLRRLQARLHQIAAEIPSEEGSPHGNAETREGSAALLSARPWEQLLYEGIMEGMGYAKNRMPFLALARSLPLRDLFRLSEGEPEVIEALLFGAAGLIRRAEDLPGSAARAHAGKLRALWKMLRPAWHGVPLAETDWLFFRLRPSNFPTVRLATVAGLLPVLFADGSFRRMIAAMKETGPTPSDRVRRLRRPFEEPLLPHAAPLGSDRVNELLTNTVIPTLLLYARTFSDRDVRAHTLHLLRVLPSGQANSFTMPIERGFPGGRRLLATALRQQGAINLYKHRCVPRRCAECDIGARLALSSCGA